MDEFISFGAWVKARRKALRLTQDELARQLGVAFGTLRKLESDERRPSPPIAQRLAELLDVPTTAQQTFVRVARAELALDYLLARIEEVAVPTTPASTSTEKASRVSELLTRGIRPLPLTPLIGRAQEVAAVCQFSIRVTVSRSPVRVGTGVGATTTAS